MLFMMNADSTMYVYACRQYMWSLTQLIYRWVLGHPKTKTLLDYMFNKNQLINCAIQAYTQG